MKRIIRSRGMGKTWDLIDYAVKNDAAIVTATIAQKKNIEDMCKRITDKKVEVYTYTEWCRDGRHNHNNKFVVDELELLTQWMLGGEMIGWNSSVG